MRLHKSSTCAALIAAFAAARIAALATVLITTLATPLAAQQRTASLIVHVRVSATGAPLSDAEILFDGDTSLGVTDRGGVLRIDAVAAGEHVIRVRFLGFRTTERSVGVVDGSTTTIMIELQPEPIRLDSLRAIGVPRTASHNMLEFYTRKERGLGYFITRADIERVQPRVFSDMLRMVPGMRIDCSTFMDICNAGMRSAPESGGTNFTGSRNIAFQAADCPIQYYVDGHYEPHANANDLSPKDIAAVEVYVHGVQAPARYSVRKNARCGVVLVWMRNSLGSGGR